MSAAADRHGPSAALTVSDPVAPGLHRRRFWSSLAARVVRARSWPAGERGPIGQILGQDLHADLRHERQPALAGASAVLRASDAEEPPTRAARSGLLGGDSGAQLSQRLGDTRGARPLIDQLRRAPHPHGGPCQYNSSSAASVAACSATAFSRHTRPPAAASMLCLLGSGGPTQPLGGVVGASMTHPTPIFTESDGHHPQMSHPHPGTQHQHLAKQLLASPWRPRRETARSSHDRGRPRRR